MRFCYSPGYALECFLCAFFVCYSQTFSFRLVAMSPGFKHCYLGAVQRRPINKLNPVCFELNCSAMTLKKVFRFVFFHRMRTNQNLAVWRKRESYLQTCRKIWVVQVFLVFACVCHFCSLLYKFRVNSWANANRREREFARNRKCGLRALEWLTREKYGLSYDNKLNQRFYEDGSDITQPLKSTKNSGNST